MESEKKKSCMFEGREYDDGAETCGSKKCMRCNDGSWEDTGKDVLLYGFGP